MFAKGTLQAAKYDQGYKEIFDYVGIKYGHRVYTAFEYKNKSKGINILVKLKAPMTIKVV